MRATFSDQPRSTTLPFVGRAKEAELLLRLHEQRKHVLVIGPEGVGKSALVNRIASLRPTVLCPQAANLSDICAALEAQLALDAAGKRLIKRTSQILQALPLAGKVIVFDGVGWTTPKLRSLIECASQRVPAWIVTRSDHPWDIGHIWPLLCRFARVELCPFLLADTRSLVAAAAGTRLIPASALEVAERLHNLAKGIPRVLCELIEGLSTGRYDPHRPSALRLLDLDRRIHQVQCDQGP